MGRLAGRAPPHQPNATAEAEGNDEAALGDEEAAQHVPVIVKAVVGVVHVGHGQDVLRGDLAARLTLLVEAEYGRQQQSNEVCNLRQLEPGNGKLEELAVDEAGETAHDQAAKDCVDQRIILED